MSKTKKQTFSRQVKGECLQLMLDAPEHWRTGLLAGLAAAARLGQRKLTVTTTQPGYAQLLARQLDALYRCKPAVKSGQEMITLTVQDAVLSRQIRQDILHWQPEFERLLSAEWEQEVRSLLQALLLASGSLAEPSSSYHLEFSIPRQQTARWFSKILTRLNLQASEVTHRGYSVLYIKDGQQVADFLLLSGAHQSLLHFESLRVDKEMKNQVNRVVNCDQANARRLAESSARQLLAIRLIEAELGLGQLPDGLCETARLRLAHPHLSIRELGELAEPPLGKSGMNHRLSKLETIAAEITRAKRKQQP